MGVFKDKYVWALALFLVLFLLFLHYKGNFELGYDEARHALQGIFFYDFFRNALHGGTWSLQGFLADYTKKYVDIGYQAIHDPPAHAVSTALVYSVFGVNIFAARFATQIFALVGTILLYMLALRVFGSKPLAFVSAALFALMPQTYYFSRLSFVEVPMGFLTVGWFYFLFYGNLKKLSVRLSEGAVLRLDLNLALSSLFLVFFALMKYQCIIYVALFYVFYLAYLLFAARGTLPLSNYQDLAAYFRQSGAWDIIKKGIWQAVIFAVIAAPWLNFSLFRMGHLERLLAEGFQWPAFSHHVDWGFTPEGIWRSGKFAEIVFAPIAVLFQFRFFSLFALIPVIAYFASKSRKESFMARNMHMALFVLAVYLFSTFGMSQHQLRYAMNMLPFIAVFMVQGVVQFSEFVASRFKLASLFVFIIIAALFVYSDMGIASGHNAEFGKIDNEIVDYFKQQPLPRAVINLRPRGEYTRNYYYSPDMFIFKMISAKPEFNPARIPQIVQYIDWENALEVDRKYEGFLASLNSADQKLDVYVVMFNFSSYSNLVVPVSRILGAYNWSRAELENWVVYRRPAS